MNKNDLIKALQAEAAGKPTIPSATAINLAKQLNERDAGTGRYYLKNLSHVEYTVAMKAIAGIKTGRI